MKIYLWLYFIQNIDIIAIKWCSLGRSFTTNMTYLIPNDEVTPFDGTYRKRFELTDKEFKSKNQCYSRFVESIFLGASWIRICTYPLVTDTDPDHSIIKQK